MIVTTKKNELPFYQATRFFLNTIVDNRDGKSIWLFFRLFP